MDFAIAPELKSEIKRVSCIHLQFYNGQSIQRERSDRSNLFESRPAVTTSTTRLPYLRHGLSQPQSAHPAFPDKGVRVSIKYDTPRLGQKGHRGWPHRAGNQHSNVNTVPCLGLRTLTVKPSMDDDFYSVYSY